MATGTSANAQQLVDDFNIAQTATIETLYSDGTDRGYNDSKTAGNPTEGNAEAIGKGELCEIVDLYSSEKVSCSCCKEWVESKPFVGKDTPQKRAADGRLATFAINRRMETHGGPDRWRIHSLVINSTRVQAALAKVFKDYPVSYGTDFDLVLEPLFIPFLHRWQEFLAAIEAEQDEITKAHLGLLRDTLSQELGTAFKRFARASDTGCIEFIDIGLAFVPGDVVVNREDATHQVAGILKTIKLKVPERGDQYYELALNSVDWNGKEFGLVKRKWYINQFVGTKRLSDMPITLLKSLPKQESVKQTLIARGRKLESLTGQHFKHYDGPIDSIHERWWDSAVSAISERVMVDAAGYYKLESEAMPDLESLSDDGKSVAPEEDDFLHDVYELDYEDGSEDHHFIPSVHTVKKHADAPPSSKYVEQPKLTDEQCLIASSKIIGFAMVSKTWCRLMVDSISDIDFTDNLLEKLVMDKDEKELIVSCLSTTSSTDGFDDFVPGKGKGIILLFCGPPGVGKTLAAESVPEHLHQPLYRLNMLEISHSVRAVELNLKKALERCSRWNAVLLVDEADVFIEARSADSLERNELVSVFLRLLEYYRGVMVLTTNRIASIDPAFESRIDITLAFDDLTEDARLQIWQNFADPLKETLKLSSDDLQALSKIPLNGRQIKSTIKTALFVFGKEGATVNMRHIELIIKNRKKATVLLAPTQPS